MGESEQFSKFSLHDTENLSDTAFQICICRLVPVGWSGYKTTVCHPV